MQGKKSFLVLSTALAACFVGCEWTGSAESDSWSSAYDAMNFSGTYRAVTRQTSNSSSSDTDDENKDEWETFEEPGGKFYKGTRTSAGQTLNPNVVPSSVQIVATHGNTSYIWNDNGSGTLVFGGVSGEGGWGSQTETPVPNEDTGITTTDNTQTYSFTLNNKPVVPGSVHVMLAGAEAFVDDGSGHLTGFGISGEGSVTYSSGAVSLGFDAPPAALGKSGKKITVSYSVYGSGGNTTSFSGGGAIQYQSGAWSLTLSPEMPADADITVRYSAYTDNQGTTKTRPAVTSGQDVTALTVSQNGQNLTITLNNGIVMSGKFTNVQQTGKVNQDTNAGYNTYNAQFQVQSTDTKMVGSLNYDLQNGYRMLNGTWTWGKASYDVQAAGPAWLNSADQSTLSPGVITQ